MAATSGQETVDRLAGYATSHDVLLIAGPTASGKSALAIEVARRTNGVVINADSMQVYGGLRILTARPSVAEEASADHRLYGFVDPAIAFSTGDYVRAITPLLAALRSEGRPAIVVGGTGLYFNALTLGLVSMPDIPASIMLEVQDMHERGGDLHRWLQREDAASAARLSPADSPRLQRAVAVKLATGKTLGEWQAEATSPLLHAGSWKGVFLAPDRAVLYARINSRFHSMLTQGALDEVRAVAALALPTNRGVMKSHGMPHLLAHLRGDMSLDEAINLGQQDTRNYAKRQFTWARRFMLEWEWIV
ncbi:MAG: tRNA (adenosine(37)-N6)-dimethylallyltransferase MiaA [Beijerinckiaceae bacterium]